MTMSGSGTRQTRRAARRKAEILEAATRVFAEKGFSRATTKDIAEAADIAEGTIYNYFPSKDDLLISLIDTLADLEARRKTYAHSLDLDTREAFHALIVQRLTILKEYNTLFKAVLPEVLVSPNLRELYRQRIMTPAVRDLEEHFQARIARGQLEENTAVSLVMRMLTALGLGLEMLVVMDDPEITALWDDPERFADILMHAFFQGILSIPAQDPPESDTPQT